MGIVTECRFFFAPKNSRTKYFVILVTKRAKKQKKCTKRKPRRNVNFQLLSHFRIAPPTQPQQASKQQAAMQSLVASLVPSVAGLTVRRRNTSAKAPAGRRASLRVVAHGGVGGSGGPQYPGKDKPHGSDQAPWRKKLILDDPDQADPENAGRGQRWTPPPTPAPAAAAPAPSNDSWVGITRAMLYSCILLCVCFPTTRSRDPQWTKKKKKKKPNPIYSLTKLSKNLSKNSS